LIYEKLDVKEQLHVLHNLAEGSRLKDILSEKVTCSKLAKIKRKK
jgi:hypothetical protein